MNLAPMIIDSFAGGGGASTGIELALGRSPDVAINHSAAALALHAANHPDTLHLDSNIWDVEPREVTKGRKVGLLWASPDCKHFSKAKGGAPRDRNIRDLAWVVVKWAEHVKPDVIAMENVEEFLTWGPVDNDGQPIREFAGQTFDDWKRRLRRAGYKVQHRELRACDYGAPTIRKRFFLIARCDGRRIVWPEPSHGDPNSPEVKRGRRKPWRTAAECIDWSIPCPSIFDTAPQIMARHGLRAIRPLADNTLARIARGMKRYVIDAERPFLVEIGYGERTGQAPRTQDLSAPLATVVAGSVKHALVAPSITRFNGGATGQELREPLATVTANSWIKKPGGAAPLGLIAPALATFYGHTDGRGVRSADLAEPLRTVTTENRHALIAPHIMTMRNAQKPFNGANEPAHTITAGGAGLSTVVASIVGCGGRAGQSRPRGLDEPAATITAKADGSRTDEPLHTVTVKDRMGHMQAALQAPPFEARHESRAGEVADFLRAQGAWSGGKFVTLTIDGTTFVVVDIGMRMLTPRELFNAQGFPPDYVIEGTWQARGDDWHWQPFTKDVQVGCCGNSVCPDLARALIAANCNHLVVRTLAA